MNRLNGNGVDGRLGFAQQLKGATGPLLYTLGKRRGAEDAEDRRQRPVRRVAVGMVRGGDFSIVVFHPFRKGPRKGWGTRLVLVVRITGVVRM